MLEATMMGIPTCVYYPIQEQEFSLGFRNDLGRKMFIEYTLATILVIVTCTVFVWGVGLILKAKGMI